MPHEPRLVSEATLARLEAQARRKPRIALMGEFSSGKSTLLNLLIGEDLLPTRVTATELPPVWFSHGAPRAYWMDRKDRRHSLDVGDFSGIPRSARFVRVFTPAPFLERCDLIDTPGISDPNLEDESWRFPVGQSNLVLWCTPATQAWRETERSTWLSLPERLRAGSILVVTRADKLAQPGDREKVARRLGRESAGLFGGLAFLSSLDAMRGQDLLRRTGDATLWDHSGGAELEARIDRALGAARAARLDLLGRYRSASSDLRDPTAATPPPMTRLLSEPPIIVQSVAVEAPESPAAPESPRLLAPLDPVRPRRVELPETRRGERPGPSDAAAQSVSDPLDEIRAGWQALRSVQPEAATVLRLTDPLPRQLPPQVPRHEDEPDRSMFGEAATAERGEPPEAPDLAAAPPHDAWPDPASRAAEAEPHPEGVEILSDPFEDAIASEPAPGSGSGGAPQGEPLAEELAPASGAAPRAVRIWREIVARSPEMTSNGPLLAMIEELLFELSREGELSAGTGSAEATMLERNQAA